MSFIELCLLLSKVPFKNYITARGGGGVSESITECYEGEEGCSSMCYVTRQVSVETIISLKNGKNRLQKQ